MNILVSGSAGFLGQRVVRLLRKSGHVVIGIDLIPENLSDFFIQADLRSCATISTPPFDACIHLASQVGGFLSNATIATLPENEASILAGITTLCQHADCQRIVYASSINVFESSGRYAHAPLQTNDQKTPYAIAKATAESVIEQQFREFTIVRPTNLFGYQQRKTGTIVGQSHVIPDLLNKIQSANDYLEILGSGLQRRNFLHVTDAARFFVAAVDWPHRGWFNLRSDIELSIKELAKELLIISQKKLLLTYKKSFLRFEPVPIELFSLDKVTQRGWHPIISTITEGLHPKADNTSYLQAIQQGNFCSQYLNSQKSLYA